MHGKERKFILGRILGPSLMDLQALAGTFCLGRFMTWKEVLCPAPPPWELSFREQPGKENTPNLSTDGMVLRGFNPASADPTVRDYVALQCGSAVYMLCDSSKPRKCSLLKGRADGSRIQSPGLYGGLSEPMYVSVGSGLACRKCRVGVAVVFI